MLQNKNISTTNKEKGFLSTLSSTGKTLRLAVALTVATTASNCMNPKSAVGNDKSAIVALIEGSYTSSLNGFVVQARKNNVTLTSLPIFYAGTADAEVAINNSSTAYAKDGDEAVLVAKNKAGTVVEQVKVTIANSRIFPGWSAKLSSLGFTNPAAVDSFDVLIYKKDSYNVAMTTWSYNPNSTIKATSTQAQALTATPDQNTPTILLADEMDPIGDPLGTLIKIAAGQTKYTISDRDGVVITGVKRRDSKTNTWVPVEQAWSFAEVAGRPDLYNHSAGNNPYKQFALTPATMLDIVLNPGVEYQVTMQAAIGGKLTRKFKFDATVINRQRVQDSSTLVATTSPVTANPTVQDFPANEWANIGTITNIIFNGKPVKVFTASANLKTALNYPGALASDIVTFVADDSTSGAGKWDPVSGLPPAYINFSQASNVDSTYVPLIRPADSAKSFFVSRPSVEIGFAEQGIMDYSTLTANQAGLNGGSSLNMYIYSQAGALKWVKSFNVGSRLTDDPATAAVETVVPLEGDPYKPEP